MLLSFAAILLLFIRNKLRKMHWVRRRRRWWSKIVWQGVVCISELYGVHSVTNIHTKPFIYSHIDSLTCVHFIYYCICYCAYKFSYSLLHKISPHVNLLQFLFPASICRLVRAYRWCMVCMCVCTAFEVCYIHISSELKLSLARIIFFFLLFQHSSVVVLYIL